MLGAGSSNARTIQLHGRSMLLNSHRAGSPQSRSRLPASLALASLLPAPGAALAEDWRFTATPYLWLHGPVLGMTFQF